MLTCKASFWTFAHICSISLGNVAEKSSVWWCVLIKPKSSRYPQRNPCRAFYRLHQAQQFLGYRNEWFVPITNHNTKALIITKITNEAELDILKDDYIIYPYSKAICQAVLLPVPLVTINTLSYDELKEIKSERGMGALGSSGK